MAFVDKEEPAGSRFWNVIEEDKPNLHNKSEEEGYGSPSPELSDEAFMEKQAELNHEWNNKVPDDTMMMRDQIRGANVVYIVCTVLFLSRYVPFDASPIQEQTWPLVIIGLLAPLHYLVSRQYHEIRWHAEDMTVVIYRKGLFGAASPFVSSATKLEQGDELVLNSDTHTWTNSDGEHKSSTSYWIEVHRNGKQCDTFGDDWNDKPHLMATLDFLRQKISQ